MPAKCLLCTQEIDSNNDYYRDLDCAFPNCSGQGYHEDCIVRYLRKKGHGTEQKTGFPCPAILDNGKPCGGCIRKTHVRTPINEKKKEQSRQAAIAVNQLANLARAAPPAKPAQVVNQKAAPIRLTAPPTVKVSSVATPRTNQKLPSMRHLLPSDDGGDQSAAPSRGTLADFLGGVSGQRTGSAKGPAWSKRSDDTSRPDDSSDYPSLAGSRAIAKNIATAPQPVVRQRVIPGWTEPDKANSKSSLEQDRARAAALRAEIKAGAARGKTASAATAPGTGLGPLATKTPTKTPPPIEDDLAHGGLEAAPWKPQGALGRPLPSASVSNSFAALSAAEPSSPMAGSAAFPPSEPPGFHLSPEEFPTFPSAGADAVAGRTQPHGSKLSVQTTVRAPSTPPAEAEPPASGVESWGESPVSPAASAAEVAASSGDVHAAEAGADADPICYYDPVYELPNGEAGLMVIDAAGNGYRVQDVYGPEPEYARFEHVPGQDLWYVVVRQSYIDSVAAAEAGADNAKLSGTVAAPTEGLDARTTAAMGVGSITGIDINGAIPSGYVDAASKKHATHSMQPPVGVQPGIVAAVSAAEADEVDDDLDDLLALCLGN